MGRYYNRKNRKSSSGTPIGTAIKGIFLLPLIIACWVQKFKFSFQSYRHKYLQ